MAASVGWRYDSVEQRVSGWGYSETYRYNVAEVAESEEGGESESGEDDSPMGECL
jgi:hypothetical protein